MVGVVVRRRARVRRDLVLVVARPMVSASRTTIQPVGVFHVVQDVRSRLVLARGRMVDAERRKRKTRHHGRAGCRRRSASRSAARRASRSPRRAPRGRPCGSWRGTRSPRSVGTATALPRSARCGSLAVSAVAHDVDPGLVPAAVTGDELVGCLRAPRTRRVRVDRRRRVEQRLHDPPRLLDAVLAREARALADHRRVEQHLVRASRPRRPPRRTPCRA